ncbi:MAG: enolase C-terminal domain-like protein, partial [Pseudomonadota bacterium]
RLAGLQAPKPATTCYTLSVDTPDAVGEAAVAAKAPLLKMKLAGDGLDAERIAAASDAAPGARFVLDANEGLDAAGLDDLLARLDVARIAMIEQPLPADADAALADVRSPAPLCADESFHTAEDIPRLAGLYDAVNIKLDKTGGLTGAIAAARATEAAGLRIMIGCMVGSSLAMAPAAHLAPLAAVVDLDGPLLLAEDDASPIPYAGTLMGAPPPALWGGPSSA